MGFWEFFLAAYLAGWALIVSVALVFVGVATFSEWSPPWSARRRARAAAGAEAAALYDPPPPPPSTRPGKVENPFPRED